MQKDTFVMLVLCEKAGSAGQWSQRSGSRAQKKHVLSPEMGPPTRDSRKYEGDEWQYRCYAAVTFVWLPTR